MNLASWVTALTILILLMVQAVDFHKATVCRQDTWLKSTELITRATLSGSESSEMDFLSDCKVSFIRKEMDVTWRRFPNLLSHHFTLELNGKL